MTVFTPPRLPVLTGALGSLLMGLGAVGVGWLPPLFDVSANRLLETLRLADGGQLVSHTAVVLGGALLLQGWLQLGLQVLGQRPHHQLGRTLAWWTLPLLAIPPLFSRDVYSYIAQGRLLLRGFNPYEHGVSALPGWFALGVDPAWAETPTPYGPVALLTQLGVVAVTPDSPWWSLLLFRGLMVLGLGLLAVGVARLAELHGIPRDAALWLAVLNPLVLMHFVAGVHNDSLMVGLLTWAFVFGYRRQRPLALALLVLAAGVKPIALLALPFVVLAWLPRSSSLRQRVSSLSWAALASVAGLAAVGAALGVGLGWVNALATPGAVKTLLSPATALGYLVGVAGGWFGVDIGEGAIRSLRLVAMLAAVVLIARLLLRPHGQSPLRAAAMAFTILILLSPVVQPWYLLWALPLIAAAGLTRAWHLRTVVVGTAFFVIYGLTEASIVSDSAIGSGDLIGAVAAAVAVAGVLLTSPAERDLALGSQFSNGLRPLTEEARDLAASQLVAPDPPR